MSARVELSPGLMPLADWRAIYRGAAIALDPIARPDVEAGKAALKAILPKTESAAAERPNGSPSVAELIERQGGSPPHGLLRLFVALKLASLGQGASGMRWSRIKAIAEFLSHDLLPVIGAEGASDRLALSGLFAALTGTGEIISGGHVLPAQKALKEAKLKPIAFKPLERRALLSGTEFSIAMALAGLFEAERVLQAAIVSAALTVSAKDSVTLLHPSVHRLYRQRGQSDVAASFRALLNGQANGARAAGDAGHAIAGHDAHRIGACLDLLRQAGALLERAANSVTEDALVLWQSEAMVDGLEDSSSAATASDLIALALRLLGTLSEQHVAALAKSPDDATTKGDAGNASTKAASFVAETRERAAPADFDPAAIRRLLPMAGTMTLVLAIEVLEATRAAAAQTAGGARLEAVRRRVLEAAPQARESGASGAGDLASVAALVGSGDLQSAAGIDLPEVAPRQPERKAFRLGGERKGT